MLYGSRASLFPVLLLLANTSAFAQDFKSLVNAATQAWDKGACKDAQSGFARAYTLASERVGVADLAEQVHVLLLRSEAYICMGEYDAAAKLASVLPADTPAARAQIQFLYAEANKGRGAFSEADANYSEAVRIAADSLPDTDPARAHYLAGWADLARLRAQYSDADTRVQAALSYLDKIGAKDSIDRANALITSGDLARDRDLWNDARARYRDALAIAQTKAADHPVAARAWIGLGLVELSAGDLAAAESNVRHAQNAARALPLSLNYANALDALGILNVSKRNFSDAEQSLKDCLEARRKAKADPSPYTAITLEHLGALYAAQQRFTDAQATLKTAEAMLRQTVGADHPQLALTLDHEAVVYRAQRKYDDARDALAAALKIQNAKFGPNSLAAAGTLTEQANLLSDQAKYAEAEQIERNALAIEDKLASPSAPVRLATVRALALTLHAGGRDKDAAPFLAEWMKARGDGLPLVDPERVAVALAGAEMEMHAGNYNDAEKSLTAIVGANDKLGKDATKLPLVQKQLGDALFAQRKWKEAARQYEAALPNVADQPGIGTAWENLGAAYAAQNLWPESARSYQKALEYAKHGAPAAEIQRLTLSLAEVSFEAGNTEDGTKYVSEWLPLHSKTGGALTPEEARIVERGASQLSASKKYAAAEKTLRVLLEAGDQPGARNINVNRVLLLLAEACAAQNKNAEAADLYSRLAIRSRAFHRVGDAEQYLLRAKALRESVPGPHKAALVSVLQDLGETYLLEQKFTDAQPAFEQARTVLQQNGMEKDARMAVSLNGLGAVQQAQRNFDEASKLYTQAYDLLKQTPNPPSRVMASVLYNIGFMKLAAGNLTEATDYFGQCLNLSEGNYTADNPPPIDQFDKIAEAYERQQRFDEAEQRYKSDLELRSKFFGENSMEAAWGYYSLAVFYNSRKQYDKAAQAGESALKIFETQAGPESDEVALVLASLSTIYGAKGDIDRAMTATARSAEIQERLGRPRDEITPTLSALGEYCRRSKDYKKALDVYQKMAKLWEPEAFASPNYQRAVLNVATAYVYLSDTQDGKDWYDRLQKGLQQQRDTMQTATFARQYAEALRSIGHEKEARKILEQAGVKAGRSR